MNALWWNIIRFQLGLPRLSVQESIDQYISMQCGEIDDWLFRASHGRIEEDNIHSHNDMNWWLYSTDMYGE